MESNFHYIAALGFLLRYCQWQKVEWKVHWPNVSLLRNLWPPLPLFPSPLTGTLLSHSIKVSGGKFSATVNAHSAIAIYTGAKL
jgi:hypothetical protein